MKRKVVTVTEYYGAPVAKRSAFHRLLDAFSPGRHDFYPPEQKRHYYPDGVTLRSIAFADGTLYGGCCALGCPRRCVTLSEFEPDRVTGFQFALQAHANALSASDLDVATEQRGLLDELRDPRCFACRASDVAGSHPAASKKPNEESSDTDTKTVADTNPKATAYS